MQMHSYKRGGYSILISRRVKHWLCARRSRKAQAAFILASFEVEVIYPGVRIGVSSVETDALQGRGNETEVALIGYFHTQQISIAGVARLAEFSIGGSVVAIVAQCLVYNEVVNLLVEDAGTDETDTFEIIFTTQIEVIGECRLQSRITEEISLSLRLIVMLGAKAEYLGRAMVLVNEARTLKSSFTSYFTRTEGSTFR